MDRRSRPLLFSSPLPSPPPLSSLLSRRASRARSLADLRSYIYCIEETRAAAFLAHAPPVMSGLQSPVFPSVCPEDRRLLRLAGCNSVALFNQSTKSETAFCIALTGNSINQKTSTHLVLSQLHDASPSRKKRFLPNPLARLPVWRNRRPSIAKIVPRFFSAPSGRSRK
ncbi:hypothetical protein PUN28_001466 [Cardiocondyla obscurior]|uniref:Uncharacterized protein n=1 Tax=Cardiocondyla obscurior TaxID=286306 RepID=A0AAW2H566_9HYME